MRAKMAAMAAWMTAGIQADFESASTAACRPANRAAKGEVDCVSIRRTLTNFRSPRKEKIIESKFFSIPDGQRLPESNGMHARREGRTQ